MAIFCTGKRLATAHSHKFLLLLHSSFPEPFAEPNLKCMKCVCRVSAEFPWLASSCFLNLINLLRICSSWLVTRFKVGFYFLKKKMLIYLLQRVWFNGGFKREYCSVKILEYSIWIFKVAVKVFGGHFHSWSGESRWALAVTPGVRTPLPWTAGPRPPALSRGGSWTGTWLYA